MHLTTAYMRRCLVALVLLPGFLLTSCEKQAATSTPVDPKLNVASTTSSRNIFKFLRYAVVPKDSVSDAQLANISIDKPLPLGWQGHRVPPGVIEKELLLKITLLNRSDSLQEVFFYPGAYFTRINLFQLTGQGNAELVHPNGTDAQYRAAFRLLQLQPHDSITYIARLHFLRTNATLFYPAVVKKDFIKSFLNDKVQYKARVNLITYVVSGVMLMMIFYSIAVYRLNRSKEFLYYIVYASSLAILMFLKSFLLYEFTEFNYLFESYWDFLVQCLGIGCYFMFIRKFLDTKTKHPFLEKTFKAGQLMIVSFTAVYTALYFLTADFVILNLFENITKQLLLVIGFVFVSYGMRHWDDKLLRFLVIGNIWLIVFSVISFLQIVSPIFNFSSDSDWNVLNNAIIYYEIGVVAELAYFLSGLAYKNRRDLIERTKERERLRLENDRKELEKQMAILEAQQEERNRISADMHDELGSGVTAIRLMSEIVKTKMKESTLPEIDKISNSANDLITKMNTIIWTMTSSNDTVENLITYIRTYAVDFFESTPVECEFIMPANIRNIQLSGEKRRNIFLAVKEALNNILKHAKATKVVINVEIDDKLCISIQDDGVGVDFETIRRFGNGLKNMKSRLERINGHFSIMNNGGALTQFEMNL
jgi:signal transduction histidine kinase